MRLRFVLLSLVSIALLLSTACSLGSLGIGSIQTPEPTVTSPVTTAPEATATSEPTATPSPTYTPESTIAPQRPTSTLISGPALPTAPSASATPLATVAGAAATPQPAAPQPTAAPATQAPASGGASAQAVKQQIQTTKRQMEEFGGMIDIAIGRGSVDCAEVVDRYDALAASPTMNVGGADASVSQAYDLYRQGVGVFTAGARDMAQNCRDFIASGGGGSIPFQQWGLARQRVNEAVELLNQGLLRLP